MSNAAGDDNNALPFWRAAVQRISSSSVEAIYTVLLLWIGRACIGVSHAGSPLQYSTEMCIRLKRLQKRS